MPKIEQDPETGRIVSTELSSEEAAELGRLGGRHKERRAEQEARELFESVTGYKWDDKNAPAHSKTLSRIAVSTNGVAAVNAIIRLLELSGKMTPDAGAAQWKPGEVCPTCKGASRPSPHLLVLIREMEERAARDPEFKSRLDARVRKICAVDE